MRKPVFIIISFIIILGVVTNVFGNEHHRDTYTYYEEVCVSKGDSYWSIAQRYRSDGMLKNEYVNYIRKFNGADNDNLNAGQKIVVPIIKYI